MKEGKGEGKEISTTEKRKKNGSQRRNKSKRYRERGRWVHTKTCDDEMQK